MRSAAAPPPSTAADKSEALLVTLLMPMTGVPVAGFWWLAIGVSSVMPEIWAPAVLAAGFLLPLLWLFLRYFKHHFVETPLAFFGSPVERAKSAAVGTFFLFPIFYGLFTMGPALLIFVMSAHAREHAGWAAPSLLVGLVGVYGGVGAAWKALALRRVERHLANLPRATVRAAAIGPIELSGKVTVFEKARLPVLQRRHLREGGGGEAYRRDFFLADDTGAVRVRLPADLNLASDDRLWLTKRTLSAGSYVDTTLMPGDPITLLGCIAMRDEAGPADVDQDRVEAAALRPPVARYLDWTALWYRSDFGRHMYVRMLGLAPQPDFLFLTDETDAAAIHRELRRRQLRALRRAALLLTLSLGFVAAVLHGLLFL